MNGFKALRVSILLVVLLVVVGTQWLKEARLADWDQPIWITIYPIAADALPGTRRYIEALSAADFEDISEFLAREGRRHGKAISRPVRLQLAAPVEKKPPALPVGDSGMAVGMWSLKMRWWAWRRGHEDGLLTPDIQVFVQYRGEGDTGSDFVLDRSVGLRKGMYALVNAWALRDMSSRNRVVITHEVMHILGATDKYDPRTAMPIHPEGYAEPDSNPLHPQRRAEIMGGRIALSPGRARMPVSLEVCLVGPDTAREIGW